MNRKFVVLVVALPLLAGCGGGSTTLVPSTEATSEQESASDVPEDVQEEDDPSLEPIEGDSEGESEPAPEPSQGSRQLPAPIGSTMLITDDEGVDQWEIEMLASNLNVNDVVAEENQFNDPPPPGFQYASADFAVTYVGPDKGFPGMDFSVAYVTADGTTHKESDVSVVGPNELSDENELYTGGETTGSVYIAVPSDQASGGTWRVTPFFSSSEFFFAAD